MDQIICSGFKAAGVASGLKKDQSRDLGFIFSDVPASVAGVFTRNRIQAAPVRIDKERIKSGKCQGIIVNSGNANCCTGESGMEHARAMTRFAAAQIGLPEDSVLVASTGVIGKPLPIERVESAVPELIQSLKPDGFSDFAEAIMTTDTVPKIVTRGGNINGKPFSVVGIAKGSGMIHPDMATMLAFICTDLDIVPDALQEILLTATDRSFHRITIDGDTSTNDTILLMANGATGISVKTVEEKALFQTVLDDVMIHLAKMVVKDAEGATKLVQICVKGADSDIDAKDIAETVALSNLVKTALFGEDANWGRIIAAAGRVGVSLNPDEIDIYFNDVMMVQNGIGCGEKAEAEATKVLKKSEFTVIIDLKMGDGCASILTCDFSVDYVKINADYRS
jgi:glutamate N-acetyltransferase/amino-acid N-acetyltransferase